MCCIDDGTGPEVSKEERLGATKKPPPMYLHEQTTSGTHRERQMSTGSLYKYFTE